MTRANRVEWLGCVEWLGSVPEPSPGLLGSVPRGFFEEGTPNRCEATSPAFIRGLIMPRKDWDALDVSEQVALRTPPRWALYGGPIGSVHEAQNWDAYLSFWAQSKGLIWVPSFSPLCVVQSFRIPWPASSGFAWTWVRETEWPRRVVHDASTGRYVWEGPGGALSGFVGQLEQLPSFWQFPAPEGWPASWPWPLPVGWAPPGWPAGIAYPPVTPTGAPPIGWETTGLPWPPPPQIWPFPTSLPPGMTLPNVFGPPLAFPTDPPLPPVPAGWPIDAAWPQPPACWPQGVPFPPPAPFGWPKDVAWPPTSASKPPFWPPQLAWPPLYPIPGWPESCPFPVALPTLPPPGTEPTGSLPLPPPPKQDEVPAGPLPPPPSPIGGAAVKSSRAPIVIGGLIAVAIAAAAALAGD